MSNDDEVKRLVRGLEAFAHASGISSATFVSALQAITSPGAVALVPPTSPYRKAATDATPTIPPLEAVRVLLVDERLDGKGPSRDLLVALRDKLNKMLE